MSRKLKGGAIKLNISLNEEQKKVKTQILENKVTIIKAAAGAGKTLLACAVALDLLLKREVKKIIIARPLVTSGNEETGFLPGGIYDKTLPYLMPIYDNMYQVLDKLEVDSMIQEGIIEICPLAYIRGRTFTNAFVILDEAQNATHQQTESFITRIGKGSKMVFCGDMSQCDLRDKKMSGFPFLRNLETIPGIIVTELKANHRDEIVEPILKIYDQYRN